jgi:tripartite-type tricarboxylate transporter receptor subunit TctC
MKRTLAVLCAFFALTGAARAEDFFAGKTITIYAGFQAGGGVDANMRVVAQHLAAFVPGNPKIVAQNMPGAAGIANANYLADKAERDGLTLGMPGRSWMLSPLLKEAGARYDPLKFAWIGSPGATNTILWVRKDTGVASIEDLKRREKPVVLGGLRLRATNSIGPLILAQKAGWPLRVIQGFEATARILLAIEQKEVDGIFVQRDTFSHRPDLLATLNPLVQSRAAEPGVPVIWDAAPRDALPLLMLALSSDNFGLPLVGPPGVPPERVEILRAAFMRMARSPAFIAESEKIGAPAGDPVDGATLAKMVADTIAGASDEAIAEYRAVLDAGK